MSKPLPRLLTYKEITAIKQVLIVLRQWLSAEQFKILSEYVDTAFEENISGKILTHQNDSWSDGLSMRDGATSVMGTVVEFLCIALLKLEWTELESSFAFSKIDQTLLNIDLYINFAGKRQTAQVKQVIYELNNRKNIRLGNDYFVNVDKELAFVDYLLLGCIKDCYCYVIPHKKAYDYFQKHKILEHDNFYCYIPREDLLRETTGMVLPKR